MDFLTWFQAWLRRHPLKEPPGLDEAHYTAEVMERVRFLESPISVRRTSRRMIPWPRLALGLAVVAAGAVAIAAVALSRGVSSILGPQQPAAELPTVERSLAASIVDETQLLESLGEAAPELQVDESGDTLAEELEAMDAFAIAQSTPSDEQWIEETLQLLRGLDEETSTDATTDESDNSQEWLNELELLDEADLTASS